MVHKAIRSFIESNENSAKEVFVLEKDVNALYDQIFRELLTYMMEDNKKIGQGMRYLLICRYLERVADHACNVAEHAIYVSTGERLELD